MEGEAPWVRTGYTGAVLAPVFVTEPGIGSQLVVVKRLPPGHAAEPTTHRRAIRDCPPAFRRHLVPQIFDPVDLPTGGVLTFE